MNRNKKEKNKRGVATPSQYYFHVLPNVTSPPPGNIRSLYDFPMFSQPVCNCNSGKNGVKLD